MPVYGKVVVIRRNGSDGSQFPLTNETCVFGRGIDCDVRVQLPYVSSQQCKLLVDENGKFVLQNLSETNQTTVNGKVVNHSIEVHHKDVLTIVDRSFRFEYPENYMVESKKSEKALSALQDKTETPLKEKQESACDSPFSLLVKDMKQSIKLKTINKPIVKRQGSKLEDKENCAAVPTNLKKDATITSKGEELKENASLLKDDKETTNGTTVSLESVKNETTVDAKENTPIPDVPHIQLGPQATCDEATDHYTFPCEVPNKKNRRRSSGSISINRKKQLALFGSPRTPKITPLRRSMGELKRKSIPLVEDLAEDVAAQSSAAEEKNWDPLPDVVEVENNSSPIKKVPLNLQRQAIFSPCGLNEPKPAVRRSSRVSFGPKLSPEQFLKHLPSNTPVKKGATPIGNEGGARRKSMRLSNLSTVVEDQNAPNSPNRPVITAQTRTPTPYKSTAGLRKRANLLQSTLKNIMDKKLSDLDDENDKPMNMDAPKVCLSSSPSTNQVKARKSMDNVPLVNIHKTATNLHKRKSMGKKSSKPLWSEIVKRRPAVKQMKQHVKQSLATMSKIKIRQDVDVVSHKDHHCDSPATLYIGRTRSRIHPVRTPKPSKGPALAKLDIPLDESFTGVVEMFQTPSSSQDSHELFENLQTPQTVGEMQVSPILDETADDEGDQQSDDDEYNLGASPLLSNHRATSSSNQQRGAILKMEIEPQDAGAEYIGMSRLFKTPKGKQLETEDNFGTKRIFTTPKDKQNAQVDEHFGTKRLLKTPKYKTRNSAVKENFGTKRLLTTPKAKAPAAQVNTNFGTQRIFHTPALKRKSEFDESICMEEMMTETESEPAVDKRISTKVAETAKREKNEPVADHYGMKRLLRTPKEKAVTELVTEHFGMVRLFQAPKIRSKVDMVDKHFGTKRVFTTPKMRTKCPPVDENYGMERLMKTPKTNPNEFPDHEVIGTGKLFLTPKEKSQPVVNKFGFERLFGMAATRERSQPLDFNESMCLDEIFKENTDECPESCAVQQGMQDKKKRQAKTDAAVVTRKSRRNLKTVAKEIKQPANIASSKKTCVGIESSAQNLAGSVGRQQTLPRVTRSQRGQKKVLDRSKGTKSVEEHTKQETSVIGELPTNHCTSEKALDSTAEPAVKLATDVVQQRTRSKTAQKSGNVKKIKSTLLSDLQDMNESSSAKVSTNGMKEVKIEEKNGKNIVEGMPRNMEVCDSKLIVGKNTRSSRRGRKQKSSENVEFADTEDDKKFSKTSEPDGQPEKVVEAQKGRKLRSKLIVNPHEEQKNDVNIQEAKATSTAKPKRRNNKKVTGALGNSEKHSHQTTPTVEEKQETQPIILQKENMSDKTSKSVTFHHSVVGGLTPVPVHKALRKRKGKAIAQEESKDIQEVEKDKSLRKQLRKRNLQSEESLSNPKSKKQKLLQDLHNGEEQVESKLIEQETLSKKKVSTSKSKDKPAQAIVLRRSSRLKAEK